MYSVFERLLSERNVKVSDVAKKTGIRQGVFSDWKMGRYTPKQDKLQKIADYFGVTLEYLMTGEDEEENPYYLNAETRKIAQFLFENPGHRVLLDASRDLRPEDLNFVMQMINRMKNQES